MSIDIVLFPTLEPFAVADDLDRAMAGQGCRINTM
jgi:hypothetical protein